MWSVAHGGSYMEDGSVAGRREGEMRSGGWREKRTGKRRSKNTENADEE